jgi:Tfp pilus assembly protein PilO
MPKNFESFFSKRNLEQRGIRFWLQIAVIVLAVLNCAALFIYIVQPGGSRSELAEENQQIRSSIAAAKAQAVRLKTISAKVQIGSKQSGEFEAKYILPKRTAYEAVIEEIQRMVKEAGLQERDAVFSEEPIEGTTDLSILNATANYGGSYESLMHFLNLADHSPMLLMLDALQVAPQQKGGQITTSIRFQAIVREDTGAAGTGGQP